MVWSMYEGERVRLNRPKAPDVGPRVLILNFKSKYLKNPNINTIVINDAINEPPIISFKLIFFFKYAIS